MIDIPDSITEDLFLHVFSLFSEVFQVVDVFLEILLEHFLYLQEVVPSGALIRWVGCLVEDSVASSEETSLSESNKLRLSIRLLMLIKTMIW